MGARSRRTARLRGALVVLAFTTARAALVDLVNPLIGTGGGNGLGSFAAANLNPGAQAPFALLRLGPDTTFVSANGSVLWVANDHIAGYSFNDTHVLAFSHTHVQGGGCNDLGNFGAALSASANISALVSGAGAAGDAPYKTRFAHGAGAERARPGYYALALPDVGGALAELVAAGARSGAHRYACPTQECTLLLDVCHGAHAGGCPAANASFATGADGALTVAASVIDNGYFAQQGGGVWVHASARLEVAAPEGAPAATAGLWSARAPLPAAARATAANDTSGSVGFYLTVRGPAVFTLRVGLSLVSPAGAAANLAAEQQAGGGGTWLDFDALANRTAGVWEAALGAVALGDGVDALLAAPAPAPPPRACPPPAFDPTYTARLPAYFAGAGQAHWLARQGLAANASADDIARHIWRLSCFAPPALDPTGWRTVLYTALYHAQCAPTTVSDADGTYIGLDGARARAPAAGLGVAFSDLSLWDIHRTQAPLLALLAPAAAASLAASLLAMARARGGRLPRWPFASVETGIMCGDHGIAVLADAALKGVAPGGAAAAAEAWAAANATLRARDAAAPTYEALGFVPIEAGQGWCKGATLTLEYAFDDAAAAVLARAAGHAAAADALAARARSYRNLWDPLTRALCPRHANGTAACASAPFPFENVWTEADGAQMAWFAPGDPAGLAALSGASYLPAWDALLAATPAWPFGTFMPNAAMWLGNEPSLFIPWQALWAPPLGAARAQRAVRDALAANYNTRFDGVPGNDDYGTMAAWTVWALLGLYPIVGTEWYALAAPTFANATAGGLRVLARNASAGAPFVSAILLNGARLGMPFARHAELLTPPAVLEFVMTDAPVAWDYAPPV